MLMCTASRTSSPWHNFVSDTDHWVDGTGSTPCLNNGGIYPHQNMLLAPINIIEAINAYFDAWGYILPLFKQGLDPMPSTQWSVSETKSCQGIDVRLAVHINMNTQVLQLSKTNWFENSLPIKHWFQFVLDNCKTGGFMLMCTASCTSSPWHNFVSDTEHWVDGTGSTPCLNNGGIYPHASKYAFMASMKSIGSKNIFTSTAEAVFSGTPLPSKQI